MHKASQIRNPQPKIRINWERVDRLQAEQGMSDLALAQAAGVAPSVISRARRGAASPTAIRAIKTVFPALSFDEFVSIPEAIR